MTVFGPDVSKWQQGLVPPIPHGIALGICRATKGAEIDPVVDNVIAWCQTNRVPFCAYHFLVPLTVHDAVVQAAAFHNAVGKDKTIPCMLDWERSSEGWEPSFSDALSVIDAIRKLGHKVGLLYTGDWYWEKKGKPTLSGHGFDLVNADYDNTKTGTGPQIYAARGGDSGPGWTAYGGLTPVLWQFTDRATWGNKTLDMNAHKGDPARLNTWFRTWEDAVAEVLYPYGYAGDKLTMEQIAAKTTVKNAHKEFWRRFKALMEASQGKIGPGTMWRSSDVQRNTFLTRHYGVTSGGCCYYEGRRYQLKKGMAHAAPPGRSFHESTFHGYAQACDVVGDLAWMHANEKAYGIKDFRTVGNEPWHVQLAEIANSVTQWISAGRPNPQVWDLPGGPVKPPSPTPTPPATNWAVVVCNSMSTIKKGAVGIYVKRLQHFLAYAGQMDPTNMANFDGRFGSGTEAALNRFLATGGKPQNGTCDDYTWNWFMDTGNGVQSLKKGDSGGDVPRMQRMLSANGFMDPANQANFDGQFGTGTETALKKFQTAKGLTVDGQCGQKTWTALLTG